MQAYPQSGCSLQYIIFEDSPIGIMMLRNQFARPNNVLMAESIEVYMGGIGFESRHEQFSSYLDGLFKGYEGPGFAIRLWDGQEWHSTTGGHNTCTLVINSPHALRTLASGADEVSLG